jgi:hypothetical protein
MSIVELLSIYGTLWCCWNDDLLSEPERNKENILYETHKVIEITDPLQGLKPFHFISTN